MNKHFNISFHNGNIHPDIIKYQKLVFDKFGLDLLQIETQLQHPDAIDNWLLNNDWDTVAIFDIDCIPLCGLEKAFKYANLGYVYGAAQHANHIPKSAIYASPAFIVFSKETYNKINKPSFMATEKGDVGHLITLEAKKYGVDVHLIWPTHVEVPKWDLGKGSCFGHGTTYKNEVYHAFESRMGNDKIFVKKCKQVLKK